ncbi:ROK family protein [Halorarum salinum]|uniref:ROK family protein n=1 Tax=Halorarum salinum TaxID=2743089 RepID=A0A7D5LD55_9EURY|nr:ROK family protein [Halobaculum salinum]QLG63811.1 ROK family protein [Halobaculum salinum]
MASYVGVDLGATNVRAVVGDEEARVLGRAKLPTPDGPTGIAITEAVLDVTRGACADAGVDPKTVQAAAVASFGPFDLAEGVVDNPANFPDTVGRIPLTGPLSNLLGTDEVHLHNDTAAGVIGERFHSERNPDDMVYLTISSGIGTGVCVDGNVLSGWDGNAGEFGHVVVDPDGAMTCGCGREGHWEAYCSGENVPRYARHLFGTTDTPTDLPVNADGFDAADVFGAHGSDPLADLVVERVQRWNVLGVANIVHAYAPLVVIVGGAVAIHNPELVVDHLNERLAPEVFTNVPEVRLTELGDDVVVKGALASALTDGTGDRSRL